VLVAIPGPIEDVGCQQANSVPWQADTANLPPPRIMKIHIAKPVVAVGLGMGVWAAFLAWYPFPISLAWPGFVLARLGVPHSWSFAVLCVFGLLAGLGLWARRKAWSRVIMVTLLLSEAYAVVAFLYVARLPVPLPTVTPYDSSAIHRKEYLEAYDGGYRDGMMGTLRTYCFRPEPETPRQHE